MIINAFIRGQSLKLPRPKIVAGSNDYHEMQIILQTGDWAGLDIWGHFTQDGKNIFDVHAVDCHVGKDQHLNLAAGEWQVYFTGLDLDGTERITTEQQTLTVQATGCICGPFPSVPLSHAEQVTQEAAQARKLAEETRKIVVDNAPLTERAEAAAQAAEAAQESAAGSMSSAAMSAQQAGRDAGQAATSAQAAETAAQGAAGSAQRAGVSTSTATTQASAAAKSATQAKASQEAAAASAAAAAGSEAGVKADADRAGAEATRAAQDAERATRAAASAEDDASFAKSSQEAAAGSAGAASTSAGQAAASEKAAQQAATNAGDSAEQAQTDALTASGAAQSAKTEAGRAKSEADRSAEAAALSVAHGITGAKVGDLMQITAVDSKGIPTALKPTTLDELEGKWELIERIVMKEDAAFSRTEEPDGADYRFKALKVSVDLGKEIGDDMRFYTESDLTVIPRSSRTIFQYVCLPRYGAYLGFAASYFNAYGTADRLGVSSSAYLLTQPRLLTEFSLKTTIVPKGAKIEIWAVRA